MGELAARHLHRSGATRIFVTNRTWERAQEMAAVFQGRAVDYKEFPAMLHEVDIVIASSGAPHYILSREDMRRVIALRKNKPMFLIDIAVPRNIDPAASDVDGVFLYSVDDLEGVVNANLQERSKQAEQAEVIVVDEVERMLSRLKLDEVTPTIISLQEQLESIRLAEVARALRRMPQLDPEHRRLVEAQVEALTKSIINKIAHLPISALRTTAGQPDGDQFLDAVRKVFHLQD
jgi:glutamyl-tRNA reductase